MEIGTLVAVVAFGVSILSMLIALLLRIAKMELRVDEMWKVFMEQPLATPGRGRRRYDRTLLRNGAVEDRRQVRLND
jgi:hypothetical protein